MYKAVNQELIKDFKDLLNNPDTKESDYQEFLERNTELLAIPNLRGHGIHDNVVISKLPIGNSYITDLAFLSKDSAGWEVYLIELEDPHKKIFNNDKDYSFKTDFTRAVGQIRDWKRYIERRPENRQVVLNQVRELTRDCGVPFVSVKFRYVLIYGRHNEFLGKEEQSDKWSSEAHTDELIYTYDSLISSYENGRGAGSELIVLSPVGDSKFKIKYLPKNRIDSLIFVNLTPETLSMTSDQEKRFRDEGFSMDGWKEGKPLEDGIETAEDKLKHVTNPIMRAVLEADVKRYKK